jgi:hypothetical protein
MIDEKKINEEVASPEEEVNLTEEDVQAVKRAIKKAQLNSTQLSPENQALFEKMMKEADMPIVLQDKDMKLGKQELDVRLLDRKNWRQMEFRQLILQNVYLKQVVMGQTDLLRMLMVIADKLGVTDIVKATDDVQEKIEEQEEAKRKALEEADVGVKENKKLN